MCDGRVFVPVRQEPLTDGNGFSSPLLPTPLTSDEKSPSEIAGMARRSPQLRDLMPKLFPTPNASDGSGGAQHPDKRRGHSQQIIDAVLELAPKLLPTPTSANGAQKDCPAEHERRSPNLMAVTAHFPEFTGKLLPTPCAQQSKNTPENHLRKKPGRTQVTDLAIIVENDLLPTGGKMLPTPTAKDGDGAANQTSGRAEGSQHHTGVTLTDAVRQTDWGDYEPAIRRWERMFGYPAPPPAEPNRNGRPRLTVEFDEWLMGYPPGYISSVPKLAYGKAIKAIGNGVFPLQAMTATIELIADLNLFD